MTALSLDYGSGLRVRSTKYADNPEAFRCVIVDDKTKITKPGRVSCGGSE